MEFVKENPSAHTYTETHTHPWDQEVGDINEEKIVFRKKNNNLLWSLRKDKGKNWEHICVGAWWWGPAWRWRWLGWGVGGETYKVNQVASGDLGYLCLWYEHFFCLLQHLEIFSNIVPIQKWFTHIFIKWKTEVSLMSKVLAWYQGEKHIWIRDWRPMLPRWGPEDPLKQCEKIPKDDGIHTSKALELGAPADSNLSLNIRRDSSCSNIYTFSGEDQRKPTQNLDYKLSSLPFAGLSNMFIGPLTSY